MPRYMGIDPGPSTGIAVYHTHEKVPWSAFQCDGESALWLINSLLVSWQPSVVAIEEFEVRNNGGTTGKDAELTRRLIHFAQERAHAANTIATIRNTVVTRKPGLVKPWATDKRLAMTGFPLGAKFKDARDAARHALYAAVRDGRERDPLA